MEAVSTAPPVAFIVAFPIFFAGLWIAVTATLGRFSGWHSLQELYPDSDEPWRARFRMQSASMGGAFGMPVNYNGCLTIDACSSGVRFRVWRIFGLLQRPFFVPWRDIVVAEKKVFLFRRACLRFADWQGGELTMRIGSWNRIAAEAPKGGMSLPS